MYVYCLYIDQVGLEKIEISKGLIHDGFVINILQNVFDKVHSTFRVKNQKFHRLLVIKTINFHDSAGKCKCCKSK